MNTFIKFLARVQKALALSILIVTVIFYPPLISGYAIANGVNDLFSVHFPDKDHGWVCGRWGTIRYTPNGGMTWFVQKTPTDMTLSAIFFVDLQHGWAVGDRATILHTSDGGKTWRKQKSPVPYVLMGLHFASPQEGWIVGERTHILHTNDGGKTWTVQFKDADFILKAVSFADARNGWAVGEYGHIYHTNNGGISWQQQAGYFQVNPDTLEPEGGNYLFDVTAIDDQTVWAVGIDEQVIKTTDGGRHWEKVKIGVKQSHLFGIASDNNKTIVIGGNGIFLCSVDGGNNWITPRFQPEIIYDWIYGVGYREGAGFVAVGWQESIYLSNGMNVMDPWKIYDHP